MRGWAAVTVLFAIATVWVVSQPQSQASARDLDCADFANQAEAEENLYPGDPNRLDADSDGIACEDLPCPCSYSPGSGGSSGGGGSSESMPPPKPEYHLSRHQAERISKGLVAGVVHRSALLDSYTLTSCIRLGEPSIDCHLLAQGESSRQRAACQFKVEVRAKDRHPDGQITTHKCRTVAISR